MYIPQAKDLFNSFKSKFKSTVESNPPNQSHDPQMDMSALDSDWHSFYKYTIWDGNKFPGGFGPTEISYIDYWDLRAKSQQLFLKNPYAQGILRRLITNIINSGLKMEAMPSENVLGFDDNGLSEWTDQVEARFSLWGKDKSVVDATGQMTWGELQQMIKLEAFISGDVLVIINIDRQTRLPQIQLVDAMRVQTPITGVENDLSGGTKIIHGVEVDSKGRHLAYHVLKPEGFGTTRISARRMRDNRTRAFLVYGSDRRLAQVRGLSLLSSIAQGLKEIDRYRDSALRKAIINSMMAMWVKKTEDKVGSLPIQNSATVNVNATYNPPSQNELPRNYRFSNMIPGTVVEELQQGEELVVHSTAGTDINFTGFEQAIIAGLSWMLEVPPEILMLSFNSNYSASQQANNEFSLFLAKARQNYASQLHDIVYENWLIQATLSQQVDNLGILQAWRTPSMAIEYQAWINAEWMGEVKRSTDPLKQTKATILQIQHGLTSYERGARELNGSNVYKNLKINANVNQTLAEANQPLIDMQNPDTDNDGPETEDVEAHALNLIENGGN